MCAGAIMQARLKRIVYGAYSQKSGALTSVANVYEHRFGYNPMVKGGILESECSGLMNRFGGSLR
jgi:tRNA(adenine34) deaminase